MKSSNRYVVLVGDAPDGRKCYWNHEECSWSWTLGAKFPVTPLRDFSKYDSLEMARESALIRGIKNIGIEEVSHVRAHTTTYGNIYFCTTGESKIITRKEIS